MTASLCGAIEIPRMSEVGRLMVETIAVEFAGSALIIETVCYEAT